MSPLRRTACEEPRVRMCSVSSVLSWWLGRQLTISTPLPVTRFFIFRTRKETLLSMGFEGHSKAGPGWIPLSAGVDSANGQPNGVSHCRT